MGYTVEESFTGKVGLPLMRDLLALSRGARCSTSG
jgi:hypothetical protein